MKQTNLNIIKMLIPYILVTSGIILLYIGVKTITNLI